MCFAANAANLYAAYETDVMQTVPQLSVMQVSSPSSIAGKMLCIKCPEVFALAVAHVQEAAADVSGHLQPKSG